MKPLVLPTLLEVLDDVDCFEFERTNRGTIHLALVLYDAGVLLHKTQRILGWFGVGGRTLHLELDSDLRSAVTNHKSTAG